MGRHGRRLYDWWSRHRRLLKLLYLVVFLGRNRRFRRHSVDALELEPGQHVLELGCGAGNAFAALRERVTASGRVVGIDASRGMASRAADRIDRHDWSNVHVVRADAAQPGMEPAAFGAVYIAMALSAMPAPEATIHVAHACLRDGGRLVVLDARPFQHWPWRLLNPLVVPLAERLTNWFPSVDLPERMRQQFEAVSVTDWQGGSIYVAEARKGDTPADSEASGP